MNAIKIPLPKGQIKVLAAKLNCHTNTIRKAWKRQDVMYIKAIGEHLDYLIKEKVNSLRQLGMSVEEARKLAIDFPEHKRFTRYIKSLKNGEHHA